MPDTNSYLYNARGELTSATAAVDSAYRYGYVFDDIGNRKTSAERGTNSVYTASQLNQYTAVDDFTPQYDADGNETLVKTATGIWQVAYNGENRPIRWENGDTVITMSFDCMGRRVTKGDQRFVYDGYLQIAEFTTAIPNSSFVLRNSYVWDPTEHVATRPLVWQRGNSVAYYVFDGNKNVSEIVAIDNDIAAHYEYAPFGALTISRGASAVTNPWRFSSEYAEDDTATVYYNYRHYDLTTGRWMQRDPIGEVGGVNLYGFGENSVLNIADINGTVATSIPSLHSKCEDYLDDAKKSPLNKAMYKKLTDAKCPELEVECECCRENGYYLWGMSKIRICEDKISGEDDYDKGKNVVRYLYHELMHAYQNCKGASNDGCDDAICHEIDAYYNSTDFNGLGVYGETAKKEHVKSGVVKSASEACGCGKNDDACVKKIEDKFKKLYETCRQKWNERAESDK